MSRITNKKLLPIVAKLLITLGLIIFVYSQIDLKNVGNKLISVDTEFLIYAFLCHVIAYGLYATRYIYMLNQLNSIHDYPTLAKWYYFGLFCNNFLPTSFGGDVVRIYFLRKQNYSLENLIVSSFADRLIGFSSIFLMGIVVLIFNPLIVNIDSKYFSTLIVILVALLAVGLTLLKLIYNFDTRKQGLVFKFFKKIKEITHIFKVYKNKRQEILAAFLISFTAQLLIILSYCLLGISLGLNLKYFTYFAIIPIVFLTSAIPITVGGLGIREGTLIGLLSAYMIEYNDAAALSLLYLTLITSITLPAVFVPIFKGSKQIMHMPADSNQ